MSQYRFIDLFAGIGGFHYGLIMQEQNASLRQNLMMLQEKPMRQTILR